MNPPQLSRTIDFTIAAVKASRFQSGMSPQVRAVTITTKRGSGIRPFPPLARMLELNQKIQAGDFPNGGNSPTCWKCHRRPFRGASIS